MIKEFSNKIENQAKSARDLKISNIYMEKELEIMESLLNSLKIQLKESYAKVEIVRSKKDKVKDQLY